MNGGAGLSQREAGDIVPPLRRKEAFSPCPTTIRQGMQLVSTTHIQVMVVSFYRAQTILTSGLAIQGGIERSNGCQSTLGTPIEKYGSIARGRATETILLRE